MALLNTAKSEGFSLKCLVADRGDNACGRRWSDIPGQIKKKTPLQLKARARVRDPSPSAKQIQRSSGNGYEQMESQKLNS